MGLSLMCHGDFAPWDVGKSVLLFHCGIEVLVSLEGREELEEQRRLGSQPISCTAGVSCMKHSKPKPIGHNAGGTSTP